MPYTQALLSAVPIPDPTTRKHRILLTGDVPSPANPPPGCPFHPRCHHPQKDAACATLVPPLEEKESGHWVACIKQPPTRIAWEQQQAAGGTRVPERYLPMAALHGRRDAAASGEQRAENSERRTENKEQRTPTNGRTGNTVYPQGGAS
jgi:oligopeptide/dipeptide ABC transporter ATP-binding protein